MENLYIKLTRSDRMILESYIHFVEGLGQYLGDGYEIVIHSLENLNSSALKIINGFHSNRKEGAPITDLALQLLGRMEHGHKHALCYANKSRSGAPMKSATIPLLGENGRIIGLMCINFYTDTPLANILANLWAPEENIFHSENMASETFTQNTDDLIGQAVSEARETVLTDSSISSSNKNKEIIFLLHEKGIFRLKDSIVKVAALLNISKNTVYMHIRNLSKNAK